MAMLLFTEVSALGVVFLMYVLVQFWKEERRSMKRPVADRMVEFSMKSKSAVVVVTRPISHRTRAGFIVISRNGAQQRQLSQDSTGLADEISMNCFSAQAARRVMKGN